MKQLVILNVFISLCLLGFAQRNESYKNIYSSIFQEAYSENPNIPRGVLEAISYTKNHFRHIRPENEPPSCTGLPAYYGVMGLIKDGKGYFKNILYLVSEKSSIDVDAIINSPEMSIRAYAAAFSIVQNELNITSDRQPPSDSPQRGGESQRSENHFQGKSTSTQETSHKITDIIKVLTYLSELPANTDGQKYALDSYIYSILSLLNNKEFMESCGYKPYSIDLKKVFGKNNFKVLSSKKVIIKNGKVSGNNNSTSPPTPS